jgi:hypothetical protein
MYDQLHEHSRCLGYYIKGYISRFDENIKKLTVE